MNVHRKDADQWETDQQIEQHNHSMFRKQREPVALMLSAAHHTYIVPLSVNECIFWINQQYVPRVPHASKMTVSRRLNIVALICSLFTPALLGNWLTTGSHTADAGCYKCHSDAPAYFDGYLHSATTTPKLMRVVCNDDVAIYMDTDLRNLPRSTAKWIVPFITNAWRYMKKAYGSCVVPREIFGLAGPNCENFGYPKPLVALLGKAGTNNWQKGYYRFEEPGGAARPGNRNVIMTTVNDWSNANYLPSNVRQHMVWDMCSAVEFGSQGISDAPFSDTSTDVALWSMLCTYDFYNKTGLVDAAAYEYTLLSARYYDLPFGASKMYWFRDGFYPLWVESGNNMDSHVKLYELISLHYSTRRSTNGKYTEYMSQLNIGDLVHFMSAAQGRSLVAMAAPTVFKSAWRPDYYATSRTNFPALNAMYA
ncbi:hypothetical protein DFS34DRAFT_619141 [Phlyctochytrium arcticum]|nr:hypothetical protein DFS34DRAFT_619141 [Phlyctochytrium arcticum]